MVSVATCDLDKMIMRGLVPTDARSRWSRGCRRGGRGRRRGQGLQAGRLVSVPFQVACGECVTCRRGHTGNCERVDRMSMYGLPIGKNWGGFLSDTVRVPFADAMLLGVARGRSSRPRSASLSDKHPGRLSHRRTSARRAPRLPGADLRGRRRHRLYSAAIALALGAERVDLAGGNPTSANGPSSSAPTCSTSSSPSASSSTRSRSTPAPMRPGWPARSAQPRRRACARASASTSATTRPLPLFTMYSKGIRSTPAASTPAGHGADPRARALRRLQARAGHR